MSRYQVEIPEVHIAIYEVGADSEEEAIRKIRDGEADFARMEFSHIDERWKTNSIGVTIDQFVVKELSGSDDGWS